MKRWITISCGLLAVVVAAACSDGEAGGSPPDIDGDDEPVVSVETTTVERGEFEVTGDYAGEIRSEEMAELSSDVSGKIVELGVHIGDEVSRGDRLAKVDDARLRQSVRELEAGVRVSEASYEEAAVEVSNLESELQRKQPLVERQMVAEREIEELENAIRSAEQRKSVAEANIEQRKAQLESVNEDLGNTEIRAPFDGVVGQRHAERGTHVSPGQPVVTLIDGRDLYLTVHVPESQAANVDMDTAATFRIGAVGSKAIEGKIHRIAPMVDAATRTLRVDVTPEEVEEATVRPGMYARVSLELGSSDDALTVSNQAVIRRADGEYFVWKVVDGRVERQPVDFGLRGRQRSEIVAGLDDGDRIVLRGHDALEDDTKIRDVRQSDDFDASEPAPEHR